MRGWVVEQVKVLGSMAGRWPAAIGNDTICGESGKHSACKALHNKVTFHIKHYIIRTLCV